MTVIFLFILFIGACAISFFRPWVGVVACYFLVVGGTLSLWGWVAVGDLVGSGVFFYIALSTILGFCAAAISGKVDFAALKSRQNLYLLILWVCLIISYLFNEIEGIRPFFQNPDYIIENMSKAILIYFIAVLTIDNKKKCHFLVWAMIFSAIYLTYWGNMEYLEGRISGERTTLMGPGYTFGSIYKDENAFATFYVMTIPYLYFMGRYYKNRALKLFLWLNIPFAWHCIFLTSSRGGLLGLGIVTLYIVFRSKDKIFSVAILIALVLAFVYQSGSVMKERAISGINIEEDSSAQSRFASWTAGIRMMIDHPVTGVGAGNFLREFRNYSDRPPRVAHNTIIQFFAESGVLAGLMYLLLCYGIFRNLIKNRKLESFNGDPFLLAVRESLTGSLAGFFVCALFLNLAGYEIFYYTLALGSVVTRLSGIALKNNNSIKIQRELI